MGKMRIDVQVLTALHEIDCTDPEKRAAIFERLTGRKEDDLGKYDFKKIGLEEGGRLSEGFLFSINSVRAAFSQGRDFARYCVETYGIKKVGEITPEMAVGWLEYKKEEQGRSASSINAYKFSLSKLSHGIRAKGWGDGFMTDDVRKFDGGNSEDFGRILTNSQVLRFVEDVRGSSSFGLAFSLLFRFGLRVSEVIKIQGADFRLGDQPSVRTKWGTMDTSNCLYIRPSKGGLTRFLPIPASMLEEVRALKESLGDGKWFKGVTRYDCAAFMRKTTARLFGFETSRTHEFRKAWASLSYQSLKARDEDHLGRALRPDEIRALKGKVCAWLGHGEGRTDLARIYIDSGL